MRKHSLAVVTFLLALLATLTPGLSASTLVVGKPNTLCPNARYDTITAAINAAAPGDTIEVCPALYPEQLIITKPLILRGIAVDNVNRILIQPQLTDLNNLPVEAVITVMNTSGVTLQNLAVDASKNSVNGCTPGLAGIHFFNASGIVDHNAISGAVMANPQSCAQFLNNGTGVLIDSSQPGPFRVGIQHNSIHDYNSYGVEAINPGVLVEVAANAISGLGPSIGTKQFAVFILKGAFGAVSRNVLSEGQCGSLSPTDCFNFRTEGVVLRLAADGSRVDHNIITDTQFGIFANTVNKVTIGYNFISHVDVGDAIHLQGVTNSLIDYNTAFDLTPVANQSCGVAEIPESLTGVPEGNNTISYTTVNDSYCGVAYVLSSHLLSNSFYNTLYEVLISPFAPPPTEPGQ